MESLQFLLQQVERTTDISLKASLYSSLLDNIQTPPTQVCLTELHAAIRVCLFANMSACD